MSITKRACLAVITTTLALTGIPGPAKAADDVLIHHPAAFHACPQIVGTMLHKMGAHADHVHITADTAAHYRVELEATNARLIFLCNAVNETITITKTDTGQRFAAN